jgi:hypothetical protein
MIKNSFLIYRIIEIDKKYFERYDNWKVIAMICPLKKDRKGQNYDMS